MQETKVLDTDYINNILISEVSSMTEQELKELTISLRIRAQLCNLTSENMLDKREQEYNIIKVPAVLLLLLKSE